MMARNKALHCVEIINVLLLYLSFHELKKKLTGYQNLKGEKNRTSVETSIAAAVISYFWQVDMAD